jgi:hypothetical protein
MMNTTPITGISTQPIYPVGGTPHFFGGSLDEVFSFYVHLSSIFEGDKYSKYSRLGTSVLNAISSLEIYKERGEDPRLMAANTNASEIGLSELALMEIAARTPLSVDWINNLTRSILTCSEYQLLDQASKAQEIVRLCSLGARLVYQWEQSHRMGV